MIMVNEHGVIVLVNSECERLFGYGRAELLGQPIEMLIPQRFRAHHERYRGAFLASPDTRAMGAGRELFGRRKDGDEVPIEIGLNPLRTDEGLFVLASVIDITERLNAERMARVAQANTLRLSILDSLPFSIIATDTDGLILAVNPAAERLTGYSKQELIGRSSLIMHKVEELEKRAAELTQESGHLVPANFQVIVTSGSHNPVDEGEWTYVRKDGEQVPVNLAITALRDQAGQVNGFLKVAYDITLRKRAEAYIQHLAHHDSLTGLPNRTLLLDRLQMAIRLAQRHGARIAVLMIDLDQFKRINDSLGHLVGDQLLLTVAKRLEARVRKIDTVARLGGDEFIVLLTEVVDCESLVPLIGALTRTITTPMLLGEHELVITPSIGGCLYPDDGEDPITLLKNADVAMYYAKMTGRSNFKWFTQLMLREPEEKLALSTALRRAIARNELDVHFQPVVSLKNGRVVGVEALVRWSSDADGPIPPDRFVPIAEESGLIAELGERVLRTACFHGAAVNRRLGRELFVAVNVSPRQFHHHNNLIDTVKRALKDSGLKPEYLELEITEGVLMENPEGAIDMLRAIREMGAAVVVDDFGTGYSSLSYLTRFPVDKIKIDRSFVRDLDIDAADAAVINAIIAMAHGLNIRAVAEGVETQQQRRYLYGRGCDQAQGFLYSPGVPADELLATIPQIEAMIGESAQP